MDEFNNYTPNEPVQPQYQQPAPPQYPQYQQPQYQQPTYRQAQPSQPLPPGTPQPKQILVLGIIALAVSCIPFFGIGGIIIGAIGLSKSNAYANAGGIPCGMSITGRILSRVGLILSICMTVFWIVYFVFMVGLISWAYSYPHSYNYYY